MGGNALGGPDPVSGPCVRAGGGGGPVPPRAGDKVARPEGSPGRARTRPGPGRAEEAGRGRQGGVREGVTASPTSSAFVPRLSFWCQLRGKCERVNLLEGGCTPVSRAEADPPDLGTLGFHLDT